MNCKIPLGRTNNKQSSFNNSSDLYLLNCAQRLLYSLTHVFLFFCVLTGCLALWPKVLRLAWEMFVTSLRSTTPSSLAIKLLRVFRLPSKNHRLSRTETTWFGQRCSGPAYSILLCTDLSTVALITAVINGPMLKLFYGLQNNCNKLENTL